MGKERKVIIAPWGHEDFWGVETIHVGNAALQVKVYVVPPVEGVVVSKGTFALNQPVGQWQLVREWHGKRFAPNPVGRIYPIPWTVVIRPSSSPR